MPTAVRKLKKDLRKISEALENLREREDLSDWALITLMRAKTGLPRRTVVDVIRALESLVDDAFATDEKET